MKLLIVHNSHRTGSASGDDLVYRKESDLLERNGDRVIRFNPSNDEFDDRGPAGKIATALQIPWSLSSSKRIRDIVRRERPDLAHVHNFFPLVSPSVYHILKTERIPVVQTLHDFRFFCTTAFLMRDGRVCEECIHSSVLRSIRLGCFKGSKLQTIPVAIMLKLHQSLGTFRKQIAAYICLTESQRRLYASAGFSEARLHVKPNFVADSFVRAAPRRGEYALYIGRLGEEKGVRLLMKAWRALGAIPLKVVGDGPDVETVRNMARTYGLDSVEFLGFRSHDECMNVLDNARLLVAPSVCYETFGLAIVEAFSHAKPVIASRLGAMTDIVNDGKTGLLFSPTDAADLAQKVLELWNDPARCETMGRAAREEYKEKYTPERNYEMLMAIYERVLGR